jgi:Mg-chelatase subunit ChlD
VFTYLVPGLLDSRLPSTLVASLENTDDLIVPEEEEPPPEPEEPEDLEITPPEVELEASETAEADDRPLAPDVDLLGVGASSRGGHGYRARSTSGWSIPDGLGSLGGGDSPFRGFLTDLRNRGLDVVFVIDATGSMQRFIERARSAIDDIIQDLATVVPSLRIGLVAYRDLGDEWITQSADLTTDRYHIHTFLLGLRAAGGRRVQPDFEEAVEVGLEVAASEMSWREGARRVLLLVGDAPYHDDDRAAAQATVRGFGRVSHSLVNTIYVSSGDFDTPTEKQTRAREVFQRIASTGGGKAFELKVDDPDADAALRLSVTVATFGDEYLEDIAALQRAAPLDSRRASVERHVARRDRAWLIRRMASEPIHPAVAAACRDLLDGRIAAAMLQQLENTNLAPPLRTAALYVLQSAIQDVREIPYDIYQPAEEQRVMLAEIRHYVRQVNGASRYLDGEAGTVVPPSRPALPSGGGG